MNQTQPSIGIVSVGTYSPKKFITSKEIAEISGLPEEVIRDKMGIHRKFIGDENDHPNEMGIQAALDCLAKTNIPAEEIDVVLCTTEEWKEYLLGVPNRREKSVGDGSAHPLCNDGQCLEARQRYADRRSGNQYDFDRGRLQGFRFY
jgi:hypothetical protein